MPAGEGRGQCPRRAPTCGTQHGACRTRISLRPFKKTTSITVFLQTGKVRLRHTPFNLPKATQLVSDRPAGETKAAWAQGAGGSGEEAAAEGEAAERGRRGTDVRGPGQNLRPTGGGDPSGRGVPPDGHQHARTPCGGPAAATTPPGPGQCPQGSRRALTSTGPLGSGVLSQRALVPSSAGHEKPWPVPKAKPPPSSPRGQVPSCRRSRF